MKPSDIDVDAPAMAETALTERLRESERRLRELQRIANLGSWDWNVATGELWWSDQVYSIFGLDPEQCRATYDLFLKGIHPDDLGRVQAAISRALQSGGAYDIGHRVLRPDGAIRFVRERGEIWLEDNGVATRMSGTIQDVTERHLAEQALLKSESRLAAIIETAPEAVIVTDKNGLIEVFNRGAEAIFGYTPAEVEGLSLEILIPEGKRVAHHGHMEAFKMSREQRRMMDVRREISGLRKDGSIFPAAASVSRINVDGDEIFVAILRDVSDLRQVERSLRGALADAEKANRAKSEFLATMSHELRTPLNAVLGFSEIIRTACLGPVGNEKYAEYADNIFESGEYLLSLVNDLLDFSAIEDGRRPLDLEKLSLHRVVHDSVNIVRNRAEEKGIKVVTNLADGMEDMIGDARAVQQVLLNLLSNSIKFTSEGGTIQVSTLTVGDLAQITVADTGIGIPEEAIPTLTNPFRQFNKNPYRREKGWGLGLSISKSLVDLHGGRMEIESEVDKGTTITVFLPLAGPDGAGATVPK